MSKALQVPILILCEGSNSLVHYGGMCKMCGRYPSLDECGRAIEHDRPDVLAMIDRGDFDHKEEQ